MRTYSRNAAVWVGGGLVGGIVLGLLASEIWLFIAVLAVGLIGGVINWQKVQRIVNHKDPQ